MWHHTKEAKRKIGEASKKRVRHKITKERIRKSIKNLWKNPEYRKKQVGCNNYLWKGGKMISQGYILIYMPNHPYAYRKYVRQHRFIIERQIGRYLFPKEMPHHINRIKSDNRPKNLMLFKSKSAHVRFEKGGKVKVKEIIFDGRNI